MDSAARSLYTPCGGKRTPWSRQRGIRSASRVSADFESESDCFLSPQLHYRQHPRQDLHSFLASWTTSSTIGCQRRFRAGSAAASIRWEIEKFRIRSTKFHETKQRRQRVAALNAFGRQAVLADVGCGDCFSIVWSP